MINNATDEAGNKSIKGKFLDFKIYADGEHHQAGFNANLLPIDSGANTATRGQWQPAEIEVPSTTGTPGAAFTFEILGVGPSDPGTSPATGHNAKSLIAGYEVSRALPNETDPNVPGDSNSIDQNWIMSLFTDGSNQDPDVISMLEITGDQAPYPYENDGTYTDTMYPGGQNNLPAMLVHDYEFITATTVGGTTRLKGGNFPCGLMRFNCQNSSDTSRNIVLQVDLVPGDHRGYLCEPMTEM